MAMFVLPHALGKAAAMNVSLPVFSLVRPMICRKINVLSQTDFGLEGHDWMVMHEHISKLFE